MTRQDSARPGEGPFHAATLRPLPRTAMRFSLSDGASRLVLLISAVVLLLSGGILAFRPEPAYAKRDAFVAALGRGERQLSPASMAREWHADIAAQGELMRRDRRLGWVLGAIGLLAFVSAVAHAGRRAESRAGA